MKTFQDVLTFFNAASPWLEKHKDESKFAYAVKKVQKQCKARWESYAEQVEDIDIEHCAVDEKTGVILKDERGGLQFTKDGIKKRNVARRTLFLSCQRQETSLNLSRRLGRMRSRSQHEALPCLK